MPPASWTIVMSLGVVSIDLFDVHQRVLSAVLLWIAVAIWLVLVVALGPRLWRDAGSPVVLTSVAASAVLGARFILAGHRAIGAVLLGLAAAGWMAFLGPVLRHWRTPTAGVAFVLGVATDGLTVDSALLAVAFHAGWLVVAALVLALLGLGFYVFTVARFDLRQLVVGRGDHWVAGGALAISALSVGLVTDAADRLGRLDALHGALRVGTLVLWCAAVAWLVPLVVAEVRWPRLDYDVRRWATMFPLGMYAACSFTVGRVVGVPGIVPFARVQTWVALAAVIVLVARMGSARKRDVWSRSSP